MHPLIRLNSSRLVNSFPSVEISFQAACERLPLMSHTIVDIDTELHRAVNTRYLSNSEVKTESAAAKFVLAALRSPSRRRHIFFHFQSAFEKMLWLVKLEVLKDH